MAKYLLLLWFQIKAAFKSLPKLICATLIFASLVVLIGFCGTKLLTNSKSSSKMDIAVVLPPDGDAYTSLAFSFLSEIETVKNVCTFKEMSKESAYEGLKSGSIYAIILVPDNFINHIIDGTNTPANIIFPRSGIGTKSMLFRTLVNSGVTDIGAAQAGIYAVDDVCNYYKIKDGVVKSEDFLNKAYFSYALDRSVYFKTNTISATGNLTIIEFYICSGIVLLLLLSGISCSDLLKRENSALSISLKRRRIPIFLLFIFKIVGVTLVFFTMLIFAYMMTALAQIRFPAISNVLVYLNFTSLISLFLLIFGVFSMILFIFQFANSQSLGVLLLFTLSTLMLFISGGFIPSSLLPEIVQKIGVFLPTTYFIKLCGEIITNTTTVGTFIINVGFSGLFIGGAAFFDHVQQNRL